MHLHRHHQNLSGLLHDFIERQIRELALCSNPLSFRSGGDPRQPIARLLLICFGEELSEPKGELLEHIKSLGLRRFVRST
jgi:hypothetical protein